MQPARSKAFEKLQSSASKHRHVTRPLDVIHTGQRGILVPARTTKKGYRSNGTIRRGRRENVGLIVQIIEILIPFPEVVTVTSIMPDERHLRVRAREGVTPERCATQKRKANATRTPPAAVHVTPHACRLCLFLPFHPLFYSDETGMCIWQYCQFFNGLSIRTFL